MPTIVAHIDLWKYSFHDKIYFFLLIIKPQRKVRFFVNFVNERSKRINLCFLIFTAQFAHDYQGCQHVWRALYAYDPHIMHICPILEHSALFWWYLHPNQVNIVRITSIFIHRPPTFKSSKVFGQMAACCSMASWELA